MNNYSQELKETAQALMAEAKGILAMDESNGTCNRRFDDVSIPTTEESCRSAKVTSPSGDVQ